MDTTDVEHQVRAICLSFAEVTERASHGAPAFFVGKQFVMLWPNGHRGWLGVRLDGDVDWPEIAELVEDAYRTVAPRSLIAALDGA